jgi:hypothetical protein
MSVRVSCPYCNHAVRLAAPPADGRVACPRCGDTFPFRAPVDDDGDEPAFHDAPVAAPAAGPAARRGWSVRRTAVVAAVLGLVGVGIGVAVNYHRGRHPGDDGPDGPGAAVPPAALAGLRFLPPECNVVAGLQAGPVLAYAERTDQDPRALLAAAGLPPQVFATLDAAGLTLDQIDHVVVGANFPGKDGPAAVAVLAVVLRRPPADEDEFLHALKAKRDPNGKKDWYAVENPRLFLRPNFVRVSGREWVFALGDDALHRAAAGPAAGSGHLSAGLRELLAEKLPPDAAVWLAADDRDWAGKQLLTGALAQADQTKALVPLLAKGEAAAVGLSFGDPPRARVYVRVTDEPTGERLRAYFQRKAGDGAVVGGAGRSALYDAPFDPRSGPGPLRGFLEDAGK